MLLKRVKNIIVLYPWWEACNDNSRHKSAWHNRLVLDPFVQLGVARIETLVHSLFELNFSLNISDLLQFDCHLSSFLG